MMRMPMGGIPPAFGGPPFGMKHNNSIINHALASEQEEKKKEFARGIFVSGFEKSVTTAMIQHHFNIKPIFGLRHPVTKFKESKGFAFIYYGSEDDALYVKKTLDRTAILKDKIRITRTVISENLSKMMIKLKTHGLSEKEIQENEARYFNDENLEKEVERIIKPLLGGSVEVNKIAIPQSKKDKKPLRYARVFFYVSNIKEGSEIATRATTADSIPFDHTKNEYEKILSFINELLKSDPQFSRYCNSEIYEYTKKNQSNVLHIKGIKNNPKEDPAALAEEIKEFFQKQNPQWNIVNVYAAIYSQMGAWSNVTFATYDETVQAYNLLKDNRPKFRDGLIYGSLRNVKDPRTVVISVVRKDANEKQVDKFLRELADKSTKAPAQPGEEPVRKYDFFSFNIIESKKFYKNDVNETEGVVESDLSKVQESWMEINEVPRRLIIHFFNEFSDDDIKELTNDIKTSSGYEEIFLIGDSKKQLRSSHQKGHVTSDGSYVKHTEIKGKKKIKPQGARTGGPRPRNADPNQMGKGGFNKGTRPMNMNLGNFSFNKGMPNLQPGLFNRPTVSQIGSLGGLPMGLPGNYPQPGNFPPGLPNSNVPGLPTGLPSGIPTGLPSGIPTGLPPGLPSGLPTGLTTGLPGMRPPMPSGLNQPPLGSQPPTLGQQPPLMPGGFKPPGFPGMPLGGGLGGLPGMGSLPGQKPFVPGFPPQQNPIGPPKPPQK